MARRGSPPPARAASPIPPTVSITGIAGGAALARKPKFKATGRYVEGQWCASEAEATRCELLKDMERRGLIVDLVCQPKYPLVINGIKVGRYTPDFRYALPDRTRTVVEEVKGMQTEAYKLRVKVWAALYPDVALSVIKPGKRKGSTAEYMRQLWTDRIPD